MIEIKMYDHEAEVMLAKILTDDLKEKYELEFNISVKIV